MLKENLHSYNKIYQFRNPPAPSPSVYSIYGAFKVFHLVNLRSLMLYSTKNIYQDVQYRVCLQQLDVPYLVCLQQLDIAYIVCLHQIDVPYRVTFSSLMYPTLSVFISFMYLTLSAFSSLI